MTTVEMSPIARTVYYQKYAQEGEEWTDTAKRVVSTVMTPYFPDDVEKLTQAVIDRKFMPGGRYLYATGRKLNQVNNCFDGDTRIVTREGTKTLRELAGTTPVLMTTGGVWTKAEIRSFGQQSLLEVTLRRQGKDKVIYATPEHSWRVQKSYDRNNDRSVGKKAVLTKDLSPGMKLSEVFGYGITRTPVSPVGVQHGIVFGDGNVPKDDYGFNTANVRLCGDKATQLLKYFPLHETRAVDTDIIVTGLPRRYKEFPSLYEDRSYLLGWLSGYLAADGNVSLDGEVTLHSTKRENLEYVRDICYLLGIGTFEIREQERVSNLTEKPSTLYSVEFHGHTLDEKIFLIEQHRENFISNPPVRRTYWNVVSVRETTRVEEVFCAVVPETHEFVLEDNILTGNCFMFRAQDSREGWADLLHKVTSTLMTGGGAGVVYSDLRENGAPIKGTGGESSGPLSLMQMVNEIGRNVMAGGSRRSALWAGLHWNHSDVFAFMRIKDWSDDIKNMKAKDFNAYAPLDMTNVSIILDDAFFEAFNNPHYYVSENNCYDWAQRVYWTAVEMMLKTGEPGFSVDIGDNSGENLRNPCCELCSYDDSDVCCLGSLNLARIKSLTEFRELTELATRFLLCGTLYSQVPFEAVRHVRDKNRRLGLGLMGIYEWLIQRGKPYAPDTELGEWLEEYSHSGTYARAAAERLGVSVPVKTRAIAPTGSIGLIAETTTGIEPLFAVAYKRRYLKGSKWHYQYVVEPLAKKFASQGIDPDTLETAYTLALDPGRRLDFQAWVQQYVDHGISSTLNLPSYESQMYTPEDFGSILMERLPKLRGVTVYPDGSRSGQPLEVTTYAEAIRQEGVEYEEVGNSMACVSGSCGA